MQKNLASHRYNAARNYFVKHIMTGNITPIGTFQKREDGDVDIEVFRSSKARDLVIFAFHHDSNELKKVYLKETGRVFFESPHLSEITQ